MNKRPVDVNQDYAKSLADSGEADFTGYRLLPIHEDRVRIYHGNGHIDVFRQDADPEHRLPAYRMAARWFGNAPQTEGNDL